MIYINIDDKRPLYLQIYESIRKNILNGTMPKNTALLPIRVLTKELMVSKNTVEHAYQELLEEGLIRAVKGSGYYVEDIEKTRLQAAPVVSNTPHTNKPSLSEKKAPPAIRYDFRYSVGDTQFFPWSKWKQCVDDAVLDEASMQFSRYESNKGYLPLRTAIRDFLKRTRGVECDVEQVVICAGTQYALETILNLLPNNRKHVAFEEPGYIGMRQVFRNCQCDIKSVAIESDGIDMDYIHENSIDIVYLTPSHQFPTGVTTSLQKRFQLLEWAKSHNGYIIENDYDSEFMYNRRVIPSLQSLDEGNRVIYLGTLSKAISPSIRCAYYILPKQLMQVYEKKYRHCNSALPTFVQRAIARFMQDGALEKHIRKVSVLNEQKFRKLSDALNRHLPKEVQIISAPSGTHVLVQIDCCENESELITFMQKRKIGIHGTKKYWNTAPSPDNVFILGFSSIPEERIEKYVIHLAAALEEYIIQKAAVSIVESTPVQPLCNAS